VPLTIGARIIIPHPFVEPYLGAGMGLYFSSLDEPATTGFSGIDDTSSDFGGYLSGGVDLWLSQRVALNFEGKYHFVSRPTRPTRERRRRGPERLGGHPRRPDRILRKSGEESPRGPPPRRIRGVRLARGHAGGEALFAARPYSVRPFQPRASLRGRRFPVPLPFAARRNGVREDRAVCELSRQHLRRQVPGVTRIFAWTGPGAISRKYRPGDLVLPTTSSTSPGTAHRPSTRGRDRLPPSVPGFLRDPEACPAKRGESHPFRRNVRGAPRGRASRPPPRSGFWQAPGRIS